ncbi:EpsG family protein [Burkholderia alba]|uniref:EpsG family protein n=1 Tax=Burkholderia alba TaxID=2683677 RepID=UPI002B05C4FC|nr:EpsG family protein [Burkholderia alba]
MIFYLSGYACALAGAMLGVRYRVKPWLWLSLSLAPTALLVALRGSVGTDTAAYLKMARAARIDDPTHLPATLEPGFLWLLKLAALACSQPQTVVALVSLLVVFGCIAAFSGREEDALVFALLIFPLFFYDMSMNGLRYGLAFCLAKIASDCRDRGRRGVFGVCAGAAAGIHISSLLLIALLQVRKLRSLRYLAAGAGLAALLAACHYDKLAIKLAFYTHYAPPGATSGSAPLVLAALVVLAGAIASGGLTRTLGLLLLFEAASFLFARISYAGLRFQWLILFALCCQMSVVAVVPARRGPHFYLALTLIGALGFAVRARNMLQEYGVGPSPFLPYQFAWD